MAKVFLDTNVFIDIVEKRKSFDRKLFLNHTLFISPLSIHILTYLYKYHLPNDQLRNNLEESFHLCLFDKKIADKALTGPTSDFEDNVQLHSSAETECDIFLTSDEMLLNMKFFGKTKILPDLTNQSALS